MSAPIFRRPLWIAWSEPDPVEPGMIRGQVLDQDRRHTGITCHMGATFDAESRRQLLFDMVEAVNGTPPPPPMSDDAAREMLAALRMIAPALNDIVNGEGPINLDDATDALTITEMLLRKYG